MQTLEDEIARRLQRREAFDRGAHPAVDKNLSVAGLRAEARGEIDDRSDRRVVAATLKPDRPERCISLSDADAEAERVAGGAPSGGQLFEPRPHRRGHSRRRQAGVGTGNRIVEQHQHTIADEAFERAFELMNQRAERCMILPKNGHHLFRLGDLRERGEAPQIAEDDRHFAAMALQRLHGRRRQDEIGDLRRKKPLETARALDLDHLLGDPPFQFVVPRRELGRLLFGAVVQFFDSQHRPNARDQRRLIDWLCQIFVGARFQSGDHVLRIGPGCDENHRDEPEAGVAFQPPARLEPVHPRHRHVEQDQIGRFAPSRFERLHAIASFHCRIALRAETRCEDRAIVLVIVDDKDVRRIVHDAHRLTEAVRETVRFWQADGGGCRAWPHRRRSRLHTLSARRRSARRM